jgi:hypothetical protein
MASLIHHFRGTKNGWDAHINSCKHGMLKTVMGIDVPLLLLLTTREGIARDDDRALNCLVASTHRRGCDSHPDLLTTLDARCRGAQDSQLPSFPFHFIFPELYDIV